MVPRIALLLVVALGALAAAQTVAAKPAKPPQQWKKAASELEMIVYYPVGQPRFTLGFVRKIVDPYCHDLTWESLRGIYSVRGKPTRTIEIYEGSPRYCNGSSLWALPDATTTTVQGKQAVLVDLCEFRDCSFNEGAWGLEWCRRGTTVQLIAEGVSRKRLVAFGRSLRPVDGARGTTCTLQSTPTAG